MQTAAKRSAKLNRLRICLYVYRLLLSVRCVDAEEGLLDLQVREELSVGPDRPTSGAEIEGEWGKYFNISPSHSNFIAHAEA